MAKIGPCSVSGACCDYEKNYLSTIFVDDE